MKYLSSLQTALLNNPTATNNVLVTELATQDMRNKTLFSPTLKQFGNNTGSVTLDMSNITLGRTIKFPDADATLLSTKTLLLKMLTLVQVLEQQT